MPKTAEHYDLAIRGPIPFGILIPLGKMIEAIWPNTEMVLDRKQMPAGHDGTVFRIPRSDVTGHEPDPETIQRIADDAAQADADGSNDASLKHFDNQNILVSPPQELIHTLAVTCLGIMRGWPDANYLVQDVTLPEDVEDDGCRFFEITVRRRDKPTPHQLRTRAENRVTELEQQLASADAEIARLQQREAVEDPWKGQAEQEGGR